MSDHQVRPSDFGFLHRRPCNLHISLSNTTKKKIISFTLSTKKIFYHLKGIKLVILEYKKNILFFIKNNFVEKGIGSID